MTEDENRKLAEWLNLPFPEFWHDGDRILIHKKETPYYTEFYELFDPRTSIKQAMMLLDQLSNELKGMTDV